MPPRAEVDPGRERTRLALLGIGHAVGLLPELREGPGQEQPGATEAAAIAKLASDIRSGSAGSRVVMLRGRIANTEQQLAEAKAAQATSEAAHFKALGEPNEGAIDSARAEVLAHTGKVGILQTEIETLRKLATQAQQDLDFTWQRGLADLWPVLGRQSEVEHQAALNQLLALVQAPEFTSVLATLCRSARAGDWLGQFGYHSRRTLLKDGLRV